MRSRSVLLSGCVALLVLVMASTTAWGGDRDHDGGFFMRLSAGGGAARTELDVTGASSFEFSGPAGDLNFAFGAMVSPNFAVHGTLFGWLVSDPTMKVGGVEVGEANADLSMTAIGAGVTYYFMPANIYVSGSAGLGTLTLDYSGGSAETDPGWAVDFTAGKEWWVGGNWGLGVAVSVGLHSIPEQMVDENWSGTSAAVRFTASMN